MRATSPLALLLAVLPAFSLPAQVALPTEPSWHAALSLRTFRAATGELPYRFFSPGKVAAGQKLPLVLFLHGAGERGKDNTAQLVHGVVDLVRPDAQKTRRCFVLAPQCPSGVWWNDASVYPLLIELAKHTIAEEAIDPDRVYITGLSMGGFGTWHALAHDPELFAAALPICGGGPTTIEASLGRGRLTNLPVWNFHGTADQVVPLSASERMVAALRRSGNTPKFTRYEGVGHNSWTRTYANEEVLTWLFSHRRAVAPSPLIDGDRIVFLSDSIDASGAASSGWIKLIQAGLAARHPKLKIACIGAGVGDDKISDLQAHLQRDVLSQKPSVVVLDIGNNDARPAHEEPGTTPKAFVHGLRDLTAEIRAAGVRVILCTPSVTSKKPPGNSPEDDRLDDYAELTRQVARDSKVQLLDLRRHLLADQDAANPLARRLLEALGTPEPGL